MAKRRAHKKSRNGCTACKKSHTKCDELGPPCSSCALRNVSCVYTRIRAPAVAKRGLPPPESNAVPATTAAPPSDAPSKARDKSALLELELMHKWSTSTWKGSSSLEADHYWLQTLLPRDALSCPYLMDALLGSAALHVALAESDPNRACVYTEAAMAYYDSSSSGLRAALNNPDPAKYHIIVMVSQFLGAMNLCIPQCLSNGHFAEQNPLDRMAVSFKLIMNSARLATEHVDWLIDSPHPMEEIIRVGRAPTSLVASDVQPGLKQLRDLNESVHQSETGHASNEAQSSFEYYRNAIDQLAQCFAEEVRQALRGFYVGYPGLVGERLYTDLMARNPFALLVIMYWSIMIHNTSDDFWWATPKTGTDLARDIELLLNQQGVAHLPGWKDCIDFVWDKMK